MIDLETKEQQEERKRQYNDEQIYYCKNCLSLRVRDVAHIENSEYCDECGSTNIQQTTIEEWETLYKTKYGHKFLDK